MAMTEVQVEGVKYSWQEPQIVQKYILHRRSFMLGVIARPYVMFIYFINSCLSI